MFVYVCVVAEMKVTVCTHDEVVVTLLVVKCFSC